VTTTLFTQGAHIAEGRYVLESRLGSGGMATVWLARDTRLARQVAIKLPSEALTADDSFAIRFEREAQSAAALSHPNLVAVYDYGTEGERPYLVSEYVDGANLAELRERGQEPRTEVLAQALLEALAKVHEAGIVHRDVKPGNVLVDSTGRVLLTDFGIAQSTEETSLTLDGHVVGTPSYLAPEVKRGGKADARSDLYATGVLLGEQLTDDDPDRVARLVEALTESDPAARPRDAEQALELLERRPVVVTQQVPIEADAGEEPTSVQERPAARPPTPPRAFPLPPAPASGEPRRPLPWGPIAGALVGILAVAAIAFAVLGGGGDDGSSTGSSKGVKAASSGSSKDASTQATAPPATTTTETTTEATTTPAETTPVDSTGLPTPDATPDPARGSELNAQGKQLIDSGDPASAVPILEQAVAAYPADSTELDYGYALFNYAQALRLSGDPAAAIPVLERRMQIPDQLDTVKAELKTAKKEAKG
jgi:serine/threonine protein kinase